MSFRIISCVFFVVFYFYCPCRKTAVRGPLNGCVCVCVCPCRKTDDDDDDDDDKYGVRSTSTRDSIQYVVTV